MHPTKETLSAFIDGELDTAKRAEVAAIVESDPKLKAFVAEQEQLRATLQAAFAGVIASPIPERLLATVANTPISLRARMREWLGPKHGAASSRPNGRFLVPALTMAFGLVVGFGVERNTTSTGDFFSSDGGIVARAELARTLDQRLASEEQAGATRIGVTFRDKTGAICRSFEVSRDAATTDGFACRHNGDWQIGVMLSRRGSGTKPAYALAGSGMPDTVRDAITSHIEGVPFDATAERRARDRGWN